jgi:hypothetical protein
MTMKPFLTISAIVALGSVTAIYRPTSKPVQVTKSKVPHVAAQTQPDAALTPSAEIVAESPSLGELSASWNQAQTLEQLDPVAQALAEMNTPESVEKLLTGIEHIKEWPVRAALAKNLRAVSNPETLQVLLPALLNNYGRGNTILNEISDTIARLAQPETVEDLAALHWQASVQAGQGHKVLRTVASIRNPIAARGLMKVANFSESPALVAAAQEALKVIDQPLN